MATTFNPNTPLFDQQTGDVVIDPTTGDAVVCEAGRVYVDPVTLVRYDADDVVNACYYATTLRLGEARRNARLGVDFLHQVFDAGATVDLALGAIADAILGVHGVKTLAGPPAAVVFDRRARSLTARYSVVKDDGTTADVTVAVAT